MHIPLFKAEYKKHAKLQLDKKLAVTFYSNLITFVQTYKKLVDLLLNVVYLACGQSAKPRQHSPDPSPDKPHSGHALSSSNACDGYAIITGSSCKLKPIIHYK